VGDGINSLGPTKTLLGSLIHTNAYDTTLQLFAKYYTDKVCKETLLFVHLDVKRTDFESKLKMLMLLLSPSNIYTRK
jgi:hypothetical protein